LEKARSKTASTELRTIHPDAAGIDLGSRSHFVALPPGRSEEVVREFGCFTEDLEAMATWLLGHGITTVAMESTGVYWVPVFEVLERRGLDVQLVSTKHLKSVPGRKTDIRDCQWIQHLHACGLLRGSFRPCDAVCVVRGYIRHKASLVGESSRHIQRMQKALEQMNVQLHKVVTDITGTTGMAIIRAIVSGERDPKKLASLRNYRCKQSRETIESALVGTWRDEHLFCLSQELAAYEFVQKQIEECDARALEVWQTLEKKADPKDAPKPKSHKVELEVHRALFAVTGTNLGTLPGFSTENLQTVLAEVGVDMTRWSSAKAFANWATLAPPDNITGGKRRRGVPRARAHRVAECFRVAAQTLANSKTALGAFYRRMRGRAGSTLANSATANKLAKLFYVLLRDGAPYVERGVEAYEKRYRDHLVRNALRQLRRLGVPVQPSLIAGLQPAVP
jgi:transposase